MSFFDCVLQITRNSHFLRWLFCLAVVIISFVHLISRLLTFVASRLLFCDLSVQHFGIFYVEGITIRFWTGDSVFIESMFPKCSFWCSDSRSPFVFVIRGVFYRATYAELCCLVHAHREGSAIRQVQSSFRHTLIRMLLLRFISFVDLRVCDVRICLWPSTYFPNGEMPPCSCSSDSRACQLGRRPCVTTSLGAECRDRPIRETDSISDRLNMHYPSWPLGIGIITVIHLPTVRVEFHPQPHSLHLKVHSDSTCIRLLSSSDFNLASTCTLATAFPGTSIDKSATLLGHIGLGLFINLVLDPSSNCTSFGDNSCLPTNRLRSFVKSVCVRLMGFRVTLMEEILEILDLISLHKVHRETTLPTRSPEFVEQKSQPTFCRLRTSFIPTRDRTSTTSTTSALLNSSIPLHFCIAFCPCDPDLTSRDSGFRFELIRYVFRRSIQLKLRDLFFSMSLLSFNDAGSTMTSSSLVGDHLLHSYPFCHSRKHHFPCDYNSTHLCLPGSTEDPCFRLHLASDIRSLLPKSGKYGSSLYSQDAMVPDLQTPSLFVSWAGLNKMEVTSGWHDELNGCILQLRIHTFRVVIQCSPSRCDIEASLSLCQASYIHSPNEILFFANLLFVVRTYLTWLLGHHELLPDGQSAQVPHTYSHCHTFETDHVCREPPSLFQSSGLEGIGRSPSAKFVDVTTSDAESCHPVIGNQSGSSQNCLYNLLAAAKRRISVRVQCNSVPSDRCGEYTAKGESERRGLEVADVKRSSPPVVFILMFGPTSGVQFGFDQFTLDIQVDLLDSGLHSRSIDILLDNVASLQLSQFHIACLSSLPSQLPWPLAAPLSGQWTHPSLLLSLRFPLDWFDSACCPGPTTSAHRFGHMFSIFQLTSQLHNRHIDCLVSNMQLEVSTTDLRQLVTSLSLMLASWPQLDSSINLLRSTCATRSGSLESSSFNLQHLLYRLSLIKSVHFTGHVDGLNAFFLSPNGAIIVLRIDAAQWSYCGPSESEYLGSVNSHLSELPSIKMGNLLDRAVCTVGEAKMIYRTRDRMHPATSNITGESLNRLSNTSCQFDVFPTVSCHDLHHQWFWFLRLRVEINKADKRVLFVLSQPVECLWTLAVHLCLRDTLLTLQHCVRSLRLHLSSELSRIELKEPRNPPVPSSDHEDHSEWFLYLYAPTTIQLFMQLVSAEHQLVFCLRRVQFHLNPSERPVFSNEPLSPTSVNPCWLQFTCDKALVRCDSENIAFWKNLNLRCRLAVSQRRLANQRNYIVAITNQTFEFTSDFCSIEFPYRYLFRNVYSQAITMLQLLRQLRDDGANEKSGIECPIISQRPPDYLFHIKHFVLKVGDDPFESKLNDNYMVLLSEQIRHEERVIALTQQLQTTELNLTEIDRLACLARLEEQRAREYRIRLDEFHRDFPMTNELFTWSMDNVHLDSMVNDQCIHPDQILHRIRELDSCSPWPNLSPADFCTLWSREIVLDVGGWRFELRDYPRPWLELSTLCLRGSLVGAERCADWYGQHTVDVIPGYPWPAQSLTRNDWPLKFYYNLNANLKNIYLCYGSNWEPTVAWLSQRMEDILPVALDLSPRLGWWDKVRHILHGCLYVRSEYMCWSYSTSFNPYNTTEFLVWKWVTSTLSWETGQFCLQGTLDVSYHTASKYDGVCQLLHLPEFYLNIYLDWLSLGNPLDHHAVKLRNAERIADQNVIEHDSYLNFRGNRLAIRMMCGVRPSQLDTEEAPTCLLYTSVLKFTDRLRVCLAKVAYPIRRGSAFSSKSVRKPLFGRLLQWLDFNLYLPQLELNYWVSYANRTGVHAKTGPIQLKAELRYSIEHEIKTPFRFDRPAGLLQSFVMMPLAVCRSGIGILRRPAASWSVNHLSATVRDSRIRLRHNADLPGQVVQMLVKMTAQFQVDPISGIHTSMQSIVHSSTGEEFIMVPLVHYEQVRPTETLNCTVRVHIHGRESQAASIYSSPSRSSFCKRRMSDNSPSKCAAELQSSGCAHEVTHETLTPTHRLVVNGLKLRWTEHNRDLVYTLIDTYKHAKVLKKNLSARVTQTFLFRTGHDVGLNRVRSDCVANRCFSESSTGGITSAGPGTLPSFGVMEPRVEENPTVVTIDSSSLVDTTVASTPVLHSSVQSPIQNSLDTLRVSIASRVGEHIVSGSVPAAQMMDNGTDEGTLSEEITEIPMLTRLLKDVDTARFFAYCEEEPKQTDVVGQLHGLAVCSESPVTARNWHVELVDSQMLLKTNGLAGYVLVTAARAKMDALAHPPIWKDAQLLTKNSLVGHLEGMQYYATVGQIDPSQTIRWLSTANVSDWFHLNPDVDEDALSGRPEVVGCGRSVGGVVNACIKTGALHALNKHLSIDGACSSGLASSDTISLQRMISRCSCQVFYVHYEPADPSNLPPSYLIPPIPLDETDVLSSHEGADTVTLLHHTLNVCTNSLQYHMIVDIVNNLLLYVEPQRKAQYERNRVAFGLMSDAQVRCSILRDQEALRCLVAEQRRLERHLWSFAREVMSTFGTFPSTSMRDSSAATSVYPTDPLLHRFMHSKESVEKLSLSIHYARHLEAQIANVKARSVDRNTLLSQRLAYYQQLQIQTQRRHIRVAMGDQSGRAAAGELVPCVSVSAVKPTKASSFGGADQLSLRTGTSNSHTNSSALLHSDEQGIIVEADCVENCLADVLRVDTANQQHKLLSVKQNSHPAGVVRRSEVCFEHARWRMTENDGQIGLADVELRGFLYAKTHRQDDSGSHWLELGWIRVDSLAPSSFFKEVLVPDVGSEQYAGGPILRISCSELPPVGGLTVREAMEISVAPMVLQISKQFYRVMMPYFFPEKPEVNISSPPSAATCSFTMTDNLSTNQRFTASPHGLRMGSSGDPTVTVTPDDVVPTRKQICYVKRRTHQAQDLQRHFYRGQPTQSAHLTALDIHPPTICSNFRASGVFSQPHSNVLKTCCPLADQAIGSIASNEELRQVEMLSDSGRLACFRGRLRRWNQVIGNPSNSPFSMAPVDFISDFSEKLASQPVLSTADTEHTGNFRNSLLPSSWIPSPTFPSNGLLSGQVAESTNGTYEYKDCRDSSSMIIGPVDVMRERARQNNVFLYIKIPGFPICLSYKGEKQKNLTDVTRFQLSIPTMEYHNCVWTWLDFTMEVKARIRKQLVREVIKKKLTPRRRLQLEHLGHSSNEKGLSTASTVRCSFIPSPDVIDHVSMVTTNQEERVRREVEMLLGRHAQLQPPRHKWWNRFRQNR